MVRKRHPFSGFLEGYILDILAGRFLGGLGAWYIGGVWIEQFVEGVDLVSADSCLLHALYYCSSSVV